MINPVDIYSNLGMNKSPEKNIARKLGSGNTFRESLEKSIRENPVRAHNLLNSKKQDKKLMNACVEMESLLVSKMLKVMRDTVPKDKLFHGGFAEDIFEDMLYDEYSMKLSQNANLGIAKMLYDEMSRK